MPYRHEAALDPLVWPRNVIRAPSGMIEVDGIGADVLAAEFGTPLFVLDEGEFRGRCREFRRAFEGMDVYYAGKAFLSRAIVRLVRDEGLFLDVCSGGELATALSAGMPPKRIEFHGNNKSQAELRRALEVGVGRVVIDSHDEIDRLSRLASEAGRRLQVLIRVTVGVRAHTHEHIATAHEDQKFGFSLADGSAMRAVDRLITDGALELVGLHSHIGSQIFDTSGFELAAERLVGLYRRIREAYGTILAELNLGGGFGIAYRPSDDPAPLDQVSSSLRKVVEHECALADMPVPRLAVEPGRALAGPSMLTLYEVGTVKRMRARRYASVDGGMSDNPRTIMYGALYTAVVANRLSAADGVAWRIVGKHCEAGDIVIRDITLPSDIRVGDLLAVPATGAYGRSMASNYNHVPRPPVVSVSGGKVRLIVRRETDDDLLRLDIG